MTYIPVSTGINTVEIALTDAIKNNDLDAVRVLTTYCNNDTLNYALKTAISWRRSMKIVHFLVENGADIRVDNDVLLLEAIIRECYDIVEFFLKTGVFQVSYLNDVFVAVAVFGDTKMLELFLAVGDVNINTVSYYNVFGDFDFGNYNIFPDAFNFGSALRMASLNDRMHTVEFLISKGADIFHIQDLEIYPFAVKCKERLDFIQKVKSRREARAKALIVETITKFVHARFRTKLLTRSYNDLNLF